MSRRTPTFSIITPVYDPPDRALRAAIEAVHIQTYPDWELILADDRSPSQATRDVIAQAAAEDVRIRAVLCETNGGIVAASNAALDMATGEFIVLLDHDDLLAEDALETVADAIGEHPEADYLYSDEDKISAADVHYDEFRKPDWSPERLRGHMYCGHLSVLRASLVREVGGFRPGLDGSQDHDLVLRVTERAGQVVHIPEVLYHWRVVPGSAAGHADAKPYAWLAGRRAVEDHLARIGTRAIVDFGTSVGSYRITRELDPRTSISIVIPTRGGRGYVWGLERCFVVEMVRSALEHTNHENLEFVVVYDHETPGRALDELAEIAGPKLVLEPFEGKFNFSKKCNIGFLASRGDVIVLANDDLEVRSKRWLENLVAPLDDPLVGMTGAKLMFSDGTIQHAGHVYNQMSYVHAYYRAPETSPGYFAALHVNRECSGVTAACAALRRDVFEDVGGLCELLPVNFNDVDLSMKITHSGYRILWLANVELYHFESKTREPIVHSWEELYVRERWRDTGRDRYMPVV